MNATDQTPILPGGFPDCDAVIIIRIHTGFEGKALDGGVLIGTIFTNILGRLLQKVVESSDRIVEIPIFFGPFWESVFIFGISAGPGGKLSIERALAAVIVEQAAAGILLFSTTLVYITSEDTYQVHFPSGGKMNIPTYEEVFSGLHELKRVLFQTPRAVANADRAIEDWGNSGGNPVRESRGL